MTALISGVISGVLSLSLELIPGFAAWWDNIASDYKKFYRAIAGLVITILLVGAHFLTGFDLGLGSVFSWETLRSASAAWLAFVFGADMLYQALKRILPRKHVTKSTG